MAKDPLSNPPLNTPSFTFGSEAANLEYSVLTAILGPSSECNPISDSHSSASPPPAHLFSTSSSDYSASWTGAPGNSLLPSEPNGFIPSPLLTVGGIQTIFGDSHLTPPFINHSQACSGSSSSSDILSQTFTSIDPGSSATSSSVHIPQDSFTTPVPQSMSPSQSALNPLALRWPLSSAESA